jgi:hypothetical protein
MQENMLKGMKEAAAGETDPARKLALLERYKTAKTQFDEADNHYIQAVAKVLKHMGKDLSRVPEVAGGDVVSVEGQKQLLEMFEELEENPDALMAATNAIYLQTMDDVRRVEQELRELEHNLDEKKKAGGQETPQDKEARRVLLTRIKDLGVDAVFFAAEAYHSEGPMKHVVNAGQKSRQEVTSDPVLSQLPPAEQKTKIREKVQEKLKNLGVLQFLQSFNEQLGDFLKDIKHYEKASPFPGLGFYRSSKYLERLCEAMFWIGERLQAEAEKQENEAVRREALKQAAAYKQLKIAGRAPEVLQGQLGKLVEVRGGQVGFRDGEGNLAADQQKEAEAYAMQVVGSVFPGVRTLRDLAALVKAAGQQVNVFIRNADAALKMVAREVSPYFPKEKAKQQTMAHDRG